LLLCSSYLALGVPNCLAIIIIINYTLAISGRAVPLDPVRIGMPRHWTKNTGGGASPSPPPKERNPSGAKGATPATGLLCELTDATGTVVLAGYRDRRAGLLAPLLLYEEKAEKEKDKKKRGRGACAAVRTRHHR
jgi:hypothetical protein